MRLPNVKMLLYWPSRMHIYGFVEMEYFFSMMEQFDSMGVPAHFSILWSLLWFLHFGGAGTADRAKR